MKYVIDIEADSLTNVKNIWLVVIKCIETGEYEYFRNILTDEKENERIKSWLGMVGKSGACLIGHNLLGYDWPVLYSRLALDTEDILGNALDTLIISKLVDYSRDGHSIEDYGIEFGFEKIKFADFSKLSPEMETYCKRDVDICEKIYLKYKRYINNPIHAVSIRTEHDFQHKVISALERNGFQFNTEKANKLLDKVTVELNTLDKDILEAFPPRLKLIREITPKETKYGTLNKSDFRWYSGSDLSEFNGGPFCRCSWNDFNPSSHKQIVQVLSDAGWKPTDKTKTHIDTERELARDRHNPEIKARLAALKISGWKVNELNVSSVPDHEPLELWKKKCRLKINLEDCNTFEIITNAIKNINEQKLSNITIPIKTLTKTDNLSEIMGLILLSLKDCTNNNLDYVKFVENEKNLWSIIVTPQAVFVDCSASFVTDTWVGLRNLSYLQENILKRKAARVLASRILLESRRRTLTEWLGLVDHDDGRIHGRFYGIGAWTHRMAHQNPNTANIPNEFDTAGKRKLLGKELRSLWRAPKNRLLVGCDAEGIQLRIFAHYINDPEFTDALVRGRKDDKTDPHSLNQRILGSVCKSRAAAKRFIYALLLGAGLGKLAEILGCSVSEAEEALNRLLSRYEGWKKLKDEVFPRDARRGWFEGLDGRKVRIPGDTDGTRRHLAMSGYLQNGEAVCMKLATLKWIDKLVDYDALLVNFVHDEWQVEAPNDVSKCILIGQMMADSLVEVGKDLKLNCPLAGSFYNDDLKDYTIGTNWSVTH